MVCERPESLLEAKERNRKVKPRKKKRRGKINSQGKKRISECALRIDILGLTLHLAETMPQCRPELTLGLLGLPDTLGRPLGYDQ
jgi:hypothetical protein